ncbi:hypothetical protein F2Q68_00015255 [Brassica cretica]|uniref:Uncharacterized protein n=1 Tax=Brassica cretica TaxID=69181 RepID=A0A8S9HRB2_BRACR|nr:hypothetical protein F2Q68_00015255 [Brassica cretica]
MSFSDFFWLLSAPTWVSQSQSFMMSFNDASKLFSSPAWASHSQRFLDLVCPCFPRGRVFLRGISGYIARKSSSKVVGTWEPEPGSWDPEPGSWDIYHEDTMMGSHPGGHVTACSFRCSILEYLMEMIVIFISPLGSARVCYLHGGVHYRPVRIQIDTSNTSPDSCVIDVKVGVVCDPIQYDSNAHDHSDALIHPDSQIWDPTLRAEYSRGRCSENYKKDLAASYLEMNAMSCWSRVKNYFRELSSSWTDFMSSRSSIFYTRLEFATLMVGFTTVLLGFIVTSNTSPDSCVIDVKVGVVCDPVQSDSTTHDHSDALIPPVSQVYPAYAETYKNHSRTSPIVLHLFQA